MSDFDKEAERERLRKKYEQDRKDREVTERMSELLLQGATMTNAHCSECADPIFRYDGQEFCPTCERPVDRTGDPENGAGEDADGTDAAETAADDQIEVTSPSDDARVRFGSDEDEPDADEEAVEADRQRRGESAEDQPRTAPDRSTQPTGVDAGDAGDLGAARASLSRTVTKLARLAEDSEDLGRTRDLLVATQEAAEALCAVRDADR